MCEEQDALTANFDAFINGLAESDVNFNMAVVTTDMSHDAGRFQSAPGAVEPTCPNVVPAGCGASTGPVLRAVDYGFDASTQAGQIEVARLQQDFRCIATVGAAGSGFEEGLEAMETSLSPAMLQSINVGFRRSDAWLMIIFLSDENDCSGGRLFASGLECEWRRDDLVGVEEFIGFLETYEGRVDGERLLVAAIVAPDGGVRYDQSEIPVPSCSGPYGDAFSGYRYQELVVSFGQRGAVFNICEDMGRAIDGLLDLIVRNVE